MLKRLVSLFHVHWFRPAWSSFAYSYEECRCSKRRVRSRLTDGYAPLSMWWLEGKEAPPAPRPPVGGTGAVRPARPLPTGVVGPGIRYHG